MDERLKLLRKKFNISQQSFSERIGITRSTIAAYETGRNQPIDAVITLICREFHVNEHWLRTGEGEMFSSDTDDEINALVRRYGLNDQERIMIEKFIELKPDEREAIIKYCEQVTVGISEINDTAPLVPQKTDLSVIIGNEQLKENTDLYQFYGDHLAAGVSFDDLTVMLDNPPETIRAPFCDGADFIMGVNGDSMEPDFSDGDMVYIHKTPDLNFGDIGMFTIGNECYIKEYGKEGLISHNPKYKIIPASKDIKTIGKVLGKVKTEE